MQKASLYAQIGVFLAFIALFFVINLLTPSKDFSEQENRYLEQAPEFSLEALFDGSFTSDFESYVTDQFAFRDTWIALKSTSELLSGKTENNNVFFCRDDTLIERFEQPDAAQVQANIDAINQLCNHVDVPVYLGLIPGAVEVWADRLPANANNASQSALIEQIYNASQATAVDILSALNAHKDEYIYYRTDHHWTTLGAYYGYCALAQTLGYDPVALDSYTPTVVSDSFYGTVYSSSGVRWVSPDSITAYVPDTGITVKNYPTGTETDGVLYDYSALDKKDKYTFFFGGNTPLLQIYSDVADSDQKLLILRDSYADSLTPYLTQHYSEIHVLDLRYYRMGVASYVEEHDIDQVLVLYSVDNFTSDANLFFAGN